MSKVDQILTLVGREAEPAIPALSTLRATVFREWPYLYDCEERYEREYLAVMFNAPDVVLVLAMCCDQIVGASTALPLEQEHDEFIQPFRDAGIDPGRVFYLAESVLLKEFRGQGVGHRFFDEREAHALRLHQAAIDLEASETQPNGRFDYLTFAGVLRDADDPRRPADCRDLAPFWKKRGYTMDAALRTTYPWREIGQAEETYQPMQFWIRPMSDLLA